MALDPPIDCHLAALGQPAEVRLETEPLPF